MTTEEFSNEFDILLNSYRDLKPYGITESITSVELDEYEKSVLLTTAQEQIIKEYYTGKNVFGESFEEKEETRKYLDQLIKLGVSSKENLQHLTPLHYKKQFFKVKKDVWFIIYEEAETGENIDICDSYVTIPVTPVSYDKYHKTIRNPFKFKGKNVALRVDIGDNLVELVSEKTLKQYRYKYITKPTPIILTNLKSSLNNLTIDGISEVTECILNPAIHRDILERAVLLASSKFNINQSLIRQRQQESERNNRNEN